ncbi:MAG: RNase J family beta-CASP ribonuclease [Candidatus Tyloplasma litorale]|nr:MAG: RNase J family beta-CASP ribonuclease [Mycoplasmatales bacterium]
MAKINILALGGLDEKQRRLYVLEIDSKIFIFDSGVYEPLNNNFGIQHFVPNIDYLSLNKDKIKAVFLSSANRMNIGSLKQLVNLKKNLKIYGSKSTLDSLKIFFGEESNYWNKNEIQKNQKIKISEFNVEAIALPSIIPGTFGYKIETNNGNILYFSDYIFDSIKEYRISPIDQLISLTKEKNLLLLSDSSLATEKNPLSSQFRIRDIVSKYFKKQKRLILTIYEDEILNIVELIKLCKENKRKLFFKSRTLFNLINIFMQNGEIEKFPIKFYEPNFEEEHDAVIVLSGTRTKLYRTVELLIEANNKKDFAFESDDNVCFLALPQPGNEHVFTDVTNKISRVNLNFEKISTEEKKLFGTTEFDIRNMVDLIKPKYFMPISSYYTQLEAAKKIAIENRVDEKNIFIGDNGEVFTIKNEINEGLTYRVKEIEAKVVEENGEEIINHDLIEERKLIGKDGVLTISFIYNEKNLLISSDIDIQMKGVVISKGQEEIINKIKELIIDYSDKSFEKKQSIKKVIPSLKKEIHKICRSNFKKVPQLLFNIMEM